MVDITRDKPIKVAVRVVVPVRDHPKFNFVGKLLGPKGNSLKRLQEDTMCKMAVLGRGSMKDRHKEEELRASGDPKFQHLSEELHVEISAFATPAEAHARIAYALAEVRRFLVPDYNDDIRQEQMWEMQVLSSQRGNGLGKNDEGNGEPSSAVEYAAVAAEDRLSSGDTMEGGPESPQGGEHPALRGVQPVSTLAGNNEIQTQTSAITLSTSLPPNATGCSIVGGGGGGIISCNNNNNNNGGGGGGINGNNGLAGQLSPGTNNGIGAANAVVGATLGMSVANAGRKRPLLAGGPRTSMTPTKRTVMSLLARARAAQAKQLPATFQRGAPEYCVLDALPLQWNYYEKPSSPRKIICRANGGSILERFEYLS